MLSIAKGVITQSEFMEKLSQERGLYEELFGEDQFTEGSSWKRMKETEAREQLERRMDELAHQYAAPTIQGLKRRLKDSVRDWLDGNNLHRIC